MKGGGGTGPIGDELSMDTQRRIEEEIRRRNIAENLEFAYEHHPETFTRVDMLYVDCYVNKTRVRAFVDTGAQMSIMSVECAKRCSIMRLLNDKMAGVAVGVGTAQILGRILAVEVRIGLGVYSLGVSVINQSQTDFILGLDMLLKLGAVVDLRRHTLFIQGDEEGIPFVRGEFMTEIEGSHGGSEGEEEKRKEVLRVSEEGAVKQIQSMGFTLEQAISALQECKGNLPAAIDLLVTRLEETERK
jgi:hypothetical protein